MSQELVEVEKKFILTPSQLERVISGATLSKQKEFSDTYYDDAQYSLTTKDFWLRSRAGAYELKVPMQNRAEQTQTITDKYKEMTDEAAIRQELKLSSELILIRAMQRAGLKPFCTCITDRKTYNKGAFTIDLDSVSFPNTSFSYDIAEIELQVPPTQMSEAEQKILSFAQEHDLTFGKVPGKVIAYLKREKPEHYRALVTSQVVKE